MKKLFLFFLLAFLLCTCRHSETILGEWVVDKVNVQFDENRNTPELVKQLGEMERQNKIVIDDDSILSFKGLDTQWQRPFQMDARGTLYVDGVAFGQLEDGRLITTTPSPLGAIVVTYRKQ